MIPKIIHYCWFGRGEMPALAIKCLASWKRYLPEYEVLCWNEDNFDLSLYPYAEEAYRERKFAFVTDVCRLYALKHYGGIYMDTDVEMLKPLEDEILENTAFSGFEDNNFLPTGLMGSVKEGAWVTDLLNWYNGKSFYQEDGSLDITPNTHIITQIAQEKRMLINNEFQHIDGYCTIYPSDYFCPKSWKTGSINLTSNTYCIHHFAGSWVPKLTLRFRLTSFLLGERFAKKLVSYNQKLKNRYV